MIMVQKAFVTGACIIALGALAATGVVSPGPVLAHSGHGNHAAKPFAAGQPGDPTKPFRTVEVIMTDDGGRMAYTPDRVHAKKGEQIRFVLRSAGLVDHEFLIDTVANNARHKADILKNPDVAHEESNGARLQPGATKEILWQFTKAGSFEFACLPTRPHESGMTGVVAIE
jgi:uncharacterized cupredoxin-like copper-binding protein